MKFHLLLHLPRIVKHFGPARSVCCQAYERVLRYWLDLHRGCTSRINPAKTLGKKMRWLMHAKVCRMSINPDRVEFQKGIDPMHCKAVESIKISGIWYKPFMVMVMHAANGVGDERNLVCMLFKYATVDRTNPTHKPSIIFHGPALKILEYHADLVAYKVEPREKVAHVAFDRFPSPFPLHITQVFDRPKEYFVHLRHEIVPTLFYNNAGQLTCRTFRL